ncbi:alpha-E domain-containing protein [Tenggerimyces flavus]|uniref:Alpha-E domain-containing protein n=1 Tax=Tenggerimyces flavus TaxID=1708749 RepID=A0ABV7YGE4_9ACTN|nr:alpha-E domain-containing protein [Tenggerimyces flavus]MBM7789265.1 putative alpha-E superfamily protein [Tenggerimyces flavus]
MLSRIAESMFWIGRYVERADSTARTLDVQLQLLLEDPWADEDTACRSLLSVMGQHDVPQRTIDARIVLARLGFESADPGSISGAISAARENARGARETLSSEFWQSLNSTWLALPEARRRAERIGPHVFFTWVRERTATLAGVVDATMSRDSAWLFLVLGRSLERVDMTARLLMTRVLAGAPGQSRPSWSTMLRSCGAYEAILRTYRGVLDEAAVVEFLLLDRLFPRSVFAALSTAESCLTELDPGPERAGVADEARRRLGRARTMLEYRRTDEIIADLPAVLAELERTCSDVSDAVTRRFFQAARAVSWAQEGIA